MVSAQGENCTDSHGPSLPDSCVSSQLAGSARRSGSPEPGPARDTFSSSLLLKPPRRKPSAGPCARQHCKPLQSRELLPADGLPAGCLQGRQRRAQASRKLLCNALPGPAPLPRKATCTAGLLLPRRHRGLLRRDRLGWEEETKGPATNCWARGGHTARWLPLSAGPSFPSTSPQPPPPALLHKS